MKNIIIFAALAISGMLAIFVRPGSNVRETLPMASPPFNTQITVLSDHAGRGGDHFRGPEEYCLALNIYHESRGEPLHGQLAVAWVVLNRANSPHYPASICGVVGQPHQFSWTGDGRSDQPADEVAWQQAQAIASIAVSLHTKIPATAWEGHALNYHSATIFPRWSTKLPPLARVGGHVFY